MTYPPTPDQSGQGGFQYDPYGSQPGSQPPHPGAAPQQPGYGQPSQPQQPGYGQPVPPVAPGYGAAPQLPPPAPGYPPPYGMPVGAQPKNGFGVTGMVTGIIGLVLAWCGIVGIVLAILGIIFGGLGIARANRGEATNKGMAITGVVLGCIALGLDILLWVWWGVAGMSAFNAGTTV
ncbi:hypothetical protein K3N28_22095 [Glycomyces sp. TRM65418]|uniref:DUF4190 domain-containing protein n=1 Tax=Glycomyces sp. TRM65418 TaxID=2867006 RepID=UPI001CE6CD77|nr:DUF4190 domain-containing protein [Glycomyces sp. TRM65418]MCC3765755.1 hypothetical protein [Glycomyces sp. TRM65418]QZD55345.1 hypothetical protein K3N28_21975 [Glycomyces sp. TRM65418]